jgi:hypothetical protein
MAVRTFFFSECGLQPRNFGAIPFGQIDFDNIVSIGDVSVGQESEPSTAS